MVSGNDNKRSKSIAELFPRTAGMNCCMCFTHAWRTGHVSVLVAAQRVNCKRNLELDLRISMGLVSSS